MRRLTEESIGEKQGAFCGRIYLNQIFTLKHVREKKDELYLGFIDFQKVYDRINREAQW